MAPLYMRLVVSYIESITVLVAVPWQKRNSERKRSLGAAVSMVPNFFGARASPRPISSGSVICRRM